MENYLLVYAERPSAGHVKEVLASEIGEEESQGVYARIVFQLLLDLLNSNLVDTQVEIWGLTPGDVPFFSEAFPETRTRLQIGEDLGDRMATSFEKTFRAEAEKVVIILAEIPNIEIKIINDAMRKLSSVPVVLGPTSRGGLYLLGMKRPGVPIFDGIDWDKDMPLPKIIENLEKIGSDYVTLDEIANLDTNQDLKRWHRVIE